MVVFIGRAAMLPRKTEMVIKRKGYSKLYLYARQMGFCGLDDICQVREGKQIACRECDAVTSINTKEY